MNLTEWQAARLPHRFHVEIEEPECADLYFKAIAAGTDPAAQEICWPLCYRVTDIVCPYGDGEHIDCALYEECGCVNPDDDPQYDGSAEFRYKFNLDKPVGDPDRYVRVWAEGSTAEAIGLALAYEQAMEEYEDRHDTPGWERVTPQRCWVQEFTDGVEEALEQELGEFRVGWFDAYVLNEGAIDESYLALELVVPEHAEGCNGIESCA